MHYATRQYVSRESCVHGASTLNGFAARALLLLPDHNEHGQVLDWTVCIQKELTGFSTSDPIFGVATGIAAYFIWENDQRNSVDHGPGNTLLDLVCRRIGVENPLQNKKESVQEWMHQKTNATAPAPSPSPSKRLI